MICRYIQGIDTISQFEDLMKPDNGEVPLDLAVSLIAVSADNSLSVNGLIGRFDDLAASIQCATPQQLMNSLFGSGKFTGNTVEYDDPTNSLIDHVFDRRLGTPIILSVLAMEIGSRVGVPITGIGMPGHFLCATIPTGSDSVVYFDPFHGPGSHSAADCQMLYQRLTSLTNWSDEFLGSTPSRQVVVRILNNLKAIYLRRNDVANIRWVMRLRTVIPELAAEEQRQFARLVRASN
ncbi:MAG: transglutaminase family protein [Ilumatobacteraceae bacterium]